MKYYVQNSTSPFAINNLFSDLFLDGSLSRKVPAINIYKTDKGYVLEANTAGYKANEIALSVDKHVLTIKTVTESDDKSEKDASQEDQREYLVEEFEHLEFSRSFTLPEDADENEITAENVNGILTVEIPKKSEYLAGPKAIQIK